MNKEELKAKKLSVIAQYKSFVKNPELILNSEQVNGQQNLTTLETFYKNFAEAYLKPAFEGFSDNIPDVKLKDVTTVPQAINASKAKGEYNTPNNEVYMYDNMFKDLINKQKNGVHVSKHEILSLLNMSIGVLCHEYQHARQQTYVNLIDNGEIEKAKQFKAQLGKDADGIASDMGFNGAECISIIQETRPDLYAELENKLHSKGTNNSSVVNAFYINRPVEVDARLTSLKTFNQFAGDVFKSGGIKESIGLYQQVSNDLMSHRKSLKKEPVAITKSDITNQLKKLTADDFANYASSVEPNYQALSDERKDSFTFSNLTNSIAISEDEFKLERYACALKEYLDTCTPDEASKMLSDLQEKSHNLSFGSKIVAEYSEDLRKKSQPTSITPITRAEIMKEGYGQENAIQNNQKNYARNKPEVELAQGELKNIEK